MIKLNWTIWLQAANFFVLMAVLNFLLYRPVRKILAQRREIVEGSYRKAEELEAQINEKMARYQERLQEAKRQGSQEKATLRSAALGEEAEVLSRANKAAADHVKTVKNQLTAEADQARTALGAEVRSLATQIATKILGRGL